MVVGDVVNGIGTVGAHFTFQPAVGVEVLITSTFSSQNANPRLTDGIINTRCVDSIPTNIKVFINNTNYLFIYLGVDANGYSGIQIK
jgi:hypothetical protein